MKIKMAAIDLDGTLLHDDMSLSDFSKDIYYTESRTQRGTHRAGNGAYV
jgi:hydroxymethylpyrimidine pyrophosphatase-like HAD family hydrolase